MTARVRVAVQLLEPALVIGDAHRRPVVGLARAIPIAPPGLALRCRRHLRRAGFAGAVAGPREVVVDPGQLSRELAGARHPFAAGCSLFAGTPRRGDVREAGLGQSASSPRVSSARATFRRASSCAAWASTTSWPRSSASAGVANIVAANMACPASYTPRISCSSRRASATSMRVRGTRRGCLACAPACRRGRSPP